MSRAHRRADPAAAQRLALARHAAALRRLAAAPPPSRPFVYLAPPVPAGTALAAVRRAAPKRIG